MKSILKIFVISLLCQLSYTTLQATICVESELIFNSYEEYAEWANNNQCDTIVGNVTFQGNFNPDMGMDGVLKVIEGNLIIDACDAFEMTTEFEQLQVISGDLEITGNNFTT